jgi:hypothetical protein
MDAGCFHFLGFPRSKNPKPKNDRMCRQDVGCIQCLEFARSANSERRKTARMPAVSISRGFCEAKTPCPKSAWMADRMSAVSNTWSLRGAQTPKGEKGHGWPAGCRLFPFPGVFVKQKPHAQK